MKGQVSSQPGQNVYSIKYVAHFTRQQLVPYSRTFVFTFAYNTTTQHAYRAPPTHPPKSISCAKRTNNQQKSAHIIWFKDTVK